MMYRFPERSRARAQMLKTNDADDKMRKAAANNVHDDR